MSTFLVQILNPISNTLEIEKSLVNNISIIEVETAIGYNSIDNNATISTDSKTLIIDRSKDQEQFIEILTEENNISISTSQFFLPLDIINIIDAEITSLLQAGSGINLLVNNSGLLVISVSGLNSAYLNDFNSAVSGLLPVIDIFPGSGISVVNNSGYYTVAVTGQFGLTGEQVDDRVASLLDAGNYINLNYNDNFNTLTISATGLQPSGIYASGTHYHTSSDITNFNSSVSGLLPVKDIIAGNNISISNTSGIYTINSTVNTVQEAYTLVSTVFNRSQTPIPKMTVVYIDGGQGDLPTVAYAIASGEGTSSKTYGITQEIIPAMGSGHVVVEGNLTRLNTDQFNPTAPQGDVNGITLYLSPTVSGGITSTKPYAPYHMVSVGKVIRTHQNQGIINVKIQNGYELEELHNVATTGAADGQFLQYDSDSKLWIPTNSGNFSSLTVNNIPVSSSGHYHLSSDILDFNSSVSGLIGVSNIIGGDNINISTVSGNYALISVTGLTSSNIIDFNSAVDSRFTSSTLLNSITRGTITLNNSSGTFNINGGYTVGSLDIFLNGVKLSSGGGDYTANNGTSFTLSKAAPSGSIIDYVAYIPGIVSGVGGGGGINVTSSSGTPENPNLGDMWFNTNTGNIFIYINDGTSNNWIEPFGPPGPAGPTGSGTISNEDIDDRINNLLSAGSGIIINYDDNNNLLTISASGTQSSSGNYSPIGHYHLISEISGLQIALDNKQPSGVYASGTHSHIVSDITNFNSGVSGLLPIISGNNYISSTFSNNIYILNATGLQPSGSYSLNDHNHLISDVSGLQTILNNKQPSGIYASGIHYHTVSDITNFNSAVSGLLPIVSGNNYINSTLINNTYIIEVTGLQPSGNYSTIGHNHTSNDIVNFNSSVSGLLFSINPGSYIDTSFVNNSYTINVTGLQPSGNFSLNGHTHQISDISGLQNSLDSKQPSGIYASGNHTHIANDIIDFAIAFSGLIPVKNILSGTNISLTNNSGIFTINSIIPETSYARTWFLS